MLETAPDSAVRDLDTALRGDSSESLAPLRAMVRAEAADRRLRDAVFAPLLPLCAVRADGFKQTLLPTSALSRIWKALRVLDPDGVAEVSSIMTYETDEDSFPAAADDLCRSAAAALRSGAVETSAVLRQNDSAQFAGFVELVPLARQALRRLPLWLRNMTGEHAATVRLLFKDADVISPDAPRA
jgi:hypothetical protein